jgi:hypothetical protein
MEMPMRRVVLFLMILASPVVCLAQPLWQTAGEQVIVDQNLLDAVLEGSRGAFEMPVGDRQLRVQVEAVSGPNLGVTSLKGLIDGGRDSFFLLCRTEAGATVAFFQPGDGTAYRLDHTQGYLAVRQVDFEALGSCVGGLPSSELPGPPAEKAPPVVPFKSPDRSRSVADDGSRHDILVGYTPRAASEVGGADFAVAECQLAVDAANLTYENSLIDSRLRLVHYMTVDYQESLAWEYTDHIYALVDPDDGEMDDVVTTRNLVGADFACVLIDGNDSIGQLTGCGVAPVMQAGDVNGDFEYLAYSIVSIQCATSAWTLAHEVGHNRGCAHNREDASIDGAYAYSYGHRFFASETLGLRTVMSYDDGANTYARIPHFSNPDVEYGFQPTGVPVGLAGQAHNTLTHNNTSNVCAAFRGERTFVLWGWTGEATGFIRNPYPTMGQAVAGSLDGGVIVLENGNSSFTGSLAGPRSYVHSGPGSAVLGGF